MGRCTRRQRRTRLLHPPTRRAPWPAALCRPVHRRTQGRSGRARLLQPHAQPAPLPGHGRQRPADHRCLHPDAGVLLPLRLVPALAAQGAGLAHLADLRLGQERPRLQLGPACGGRHLVPAVLSAVRPDRAVLVLRVVPRGPEQAAGRRAGRRPAAKARRRPWPPRAAEDRQERPAAGGRLRRNLGQPQGRCRPGPGHVQPAPATGRRPAGQPVLPAGQRRPPTCLQHPGAGPGQRPGEKT
ncbi:hypothetical protein D3C75_780100 [compost metagenome]